MFGKTAHEKDKTTFKSKGKDRGSGSKDKYKIFAPKTKKVNYTHKVESVHKGKHGCTP